MTFDEWLISRLTAWGFYKASTGVSAARAISIGLTAFQQASRIKITGTATTETVNALRAVPPAGSPSVPGLPSAPSEPVWMREARRMMGLKEIAGAKSNPVIISWAQTLGGWIKGYYTNDDIPWCGLFMAHCIGSTLPAEHLPANPLGALNWSSFGRSIGPCVGAILTFHRTGGGHVGLYVGEDKAAYHVLGGNQSNSVSITRVEKGRLEDARWPVTADAPVAGRVWLTINGELSKNEA